MAKINGIIASQRPFKAGQLRDFLHEWEQITSDPFILQWISNCELEFDYIATSGIFKGRTVGYPIRN